jgi:hypothetical protein
MRMMMKITIPFEAANKAMRDGTAQQIIGTQLAALRPEAAYFFPADDGRMILLFIDLKDPSDMPAIGEPWFQGLSARITFTPVMNPEDFKTGLAKK